VYNRCMHEGIGCGRRLSGRVVLVTGAGGGLGGAVVRGLLAEGARVAGVATAPPAVPSDAAGAGDRWRSLAADLADPAGVEAVVSSTVEHFGRLDAVTHLVGGWGGGTEVAALPPDEWHRLLRLNLTTTFLVCRAACAAMMRQGGGGRIVTFGAAQALRPPGRQAAYNAAKAAVIALTQTVAEEMKPYGITANCLLPSVIDTPANRRAMPTSDPGRWVRPEHLAELIVTLLSDAGAALTGAAIPVTGRV
jgi:NAD(P)-dependent dehydrogenase (short-subunit alcohol dehydrogenase family)